MICKKCGVDKPKDEYYARRAVCKRCIADRYLIWREDNIERVKERESYKARREYMKKYKERKK